MFNPIHLQTLTQVDCYSVMPYRELDEAACQSLAPTLTDYLATLVEAS